MASNPTTATSAAAAPAKAAPAATPTKLKKKSSGGYVVAILAVLIALGAAAFAYYRIDQERNGTPAADASTSPEASAEATSEPEQPVVEPTPEETATTTAPPPVTTIGDVTYVPVFSRALVTIPGPTGCNASYLDVDSLATGRFAGHELYTSVCGDNPVEFHVDRTSGAQRSSATNPSAQACAELVEGTSTEDELVLPATVGLTFCLLTSAEDAAAQGLAQRLAIVEVRAQGTDNSVVAAISTFNLLPAS